MQWGVIPANLSAEAKHRRLTKKDAAGRSVAKRQKGRSESLLTGARHRQVSSHPCAYHFVGFKFTIDFAHELMLYRSPSPNAWRTSA